MSEVESQIGRKVRRQKGPVKYRQRENSIETCIVKGLVIRHKSSPFRSSSRVRRVDNAVTIRNGISNSADIVVEKEKSENIPRRSTTSLDQVGERTPP